MCYNRKLILAGLLMVWGKLVILYKIITWGGKLISILLLYV